MTLPDNRPARKPRRLGLIIPWALAAILAMAWSLGWLCLARQTTQRLDAARAAGVLDWSDRKVSGFPFRLNIDLTNARWGRSVTAPLVKAQAYISASDHWTLVAPEGLILSIGSHAPVRVRAEALRASLSELDHHPARVSVEGIDLQFDAPFPLAEAREFHLHTRAGPADQGAVYVELDGGAARPGAAGSPIPTELTFDAIYLRAGALQGPDWQGALEAWRAAGGRLTARRLFVRSGGSTLIDAKTADLTLSADGHLQGVVDGAGASATPLPLPALY